MIKIVNEISVTWHRSLALFYQAIGSKKKAISCLEPIIREGSANAQDWWLCGSLYGKCGQWDEAARAFLHALRQEKDNPVYLYWLGKAQEHKGNNESALRFYSEAIQKDRLFYEALVSMGQIALSNKNYQDAQDCFKEALSIRPDIPGILNDLGLSYLGLEKVQPALDCISDAVRLDPGESTYQYNLASAHVKAGNYGKAIEILLKLKINNSPEVLETLAYCYGSIKEYDLSIKYYLEAQQLNPEKSEILKGLSAVYAINGQYHEALQIIREQLKSNPEEMEFLNNLAWIYEKYEKYPEAEENYHRSLALSPQDPHIMHNLICCLQKQKKYFEAMEIAELLKTVPGGYRTALVSLAQIYESLGDSGLAIDYYNKSLGLE